MKVIYIAGPFRARTQWGITQNVQRAEKATLKLWKEGWAVVCPHRITERFQGECSDEVFLQGCLELLKRCDAIYMLKDWSTSEGAQEEWRLAREMGIQTIYEADQWK